MTNEQLASFIKQGGNDELTPLLWEKVKKLLYRLSERYYQAYSEQLSNYGVTLWDLKQQSYGAFIKALEGYDDSKQYKFTSYLKYSFKNALRELMGRDLLNVCDSLNKPIGKENEDTELLELVSDESSLDFVEQIERAEEVEQIKRTIHKAVNELPEDEADVVRGHFLSGKAYAVVASDKGVSVESVHRLGAAAMRHLRANKDIQRLRSIFGYCSYASYHNTLSGFMRTGISNVERLAINRADIENQVKAFKIRSERVKISE